MAQTSIVDYLASLGKDTSVNSRAQLAFDNGLVKSTGEYLTLASQGKNADINTQLLSKLQTPVTPATPAAPKMTTPPGTQSTISNVSNFSNSTMTGSQIEKASSLPEPTSFVQTDRTQALSDRVSQIAQKTFSSTGAELDRLRAEQGAIIASEKAAAQAEADAAKAGIKDFVGATTAQDALALNNKKFKVEENIQLYADIQSKIVAAQEALDMGLIYEKDRPARMKFITGSESTLQKQGLATIGALQGTAAVIKGNLDLAKAYGDATINAINQDNEMSFKALNTLLQLANDNLVDLTKEERASINTRLGAIEDESARLQKNKDDVLDLMITNPKAFQAGGVTLLDSKEDALKKMLPTMAADERAKFNAEMAAKARTGSTNSSEADKKQATSLLLQYKAGGMPYDEAITRFADTLSVDEIAKIYGRKAVPSTGLEAITDSYYGQFVDEKGQVKPGYTVTIDDKGKPVIKDTPKETGGYFSNLWNSVIGKK